MYEQMWKPNPSKITEARNSRGYNISQLADLIGTTRQAVSRYEQGLSVPSERVLGSMSTQLSLPIDFFYKNSDNSFSYESTVYYRSLKSSESGIRNMIRVRCEWAGRYREYLDKKLFLPHLDIPNLDLLLNKETLTDQDIETLADTLRTYWGLGNGPIENLVYTLEKKGFIIASSSVDNVKVDACSKYCGSSPVIFLGSGDKSACRIRFSLAHELGHMIMHSHISNDDLKNPTILKRIETEANHFASSFLLPADTFSMDINSLSLNYFLRLKRKWKVSISAMIYRCQDLGIIDDMQSVTLRKQLSYRKWIRSEPLDDEILLENPKLLFTATNYLLEKSSTTLEEILSELSLYAKDLADICSCDVSYFSPLNPTIPINLKLV